MQRERKEKERRKGGREEEWEGGKGRGREGGRKKEKTHLLPLKVITIPTPYSKY